MNRKPPLTCCCPQQQVSGGGFHICLALQLLLENQNRLYTMFDEKKISILHAHVNVPEKKSEVRRALKKSLCSESSTLSSSNNEVLIYVPRCFDP